jgi:Leu/Phe-tRNA-protein transferase
VAKYIVYCLNEAGNIWRSEWIDADSDEEALDTARALGLAHGCEVWDRDRPVGKVDAEPE